MPQYYKNIKGKNYDRKLIDMADASVSGKGDGRISLTDAKKLLKTVKDSNTYSDIEKSTMSYIRDHYKFTKEADSWFRTEIRKWAATKKPKAATKPAAKPVKKPAAGPAKKAAVKPAAKAAAGPVKKAAVKPAAKAAARPAVKKDVRPVPVKSTEIKTVPVKKEEPVLFPEREKIGSVKTSAETTGSSKKVFIGIAALLFLALLIYNFGPKLKSYFSGEKTGTGTADTTLDKKPQEGLTTLPDTKKGKETLPETKPKIADKIEKTQVKEDVSKQAVKDPNVYVVVPGDQLIEISKKVYGHEEAWKKIYDANKGIIKDPALIYPGQKLSIPEADKK